MSHEGSKAWGWRHAMCAAKELPATTKHVLLTLSMFMNEFGESCFPPISDLVKYSSLDKKTVIKHLGIAREKGWVAVSQHGFRGQKWKRNEYSVRWLERDLVAPSEPLETDEGGGSPPPPSGKKVVELVPEGGGAGSQKVVEEVHQDKNIPDNIPITSPEERGRAREAAEPEGLSVSKDTWKRRFRKTHADWPTYASDSATTAEAEWFNLSEPDREAAADRLGAYVLHVREQLGRSKFCAFAVYLRDKLWERVPVNASGNRSAQPLEAKPFGKAWGAARFASLMEDPKGPPPKLTMAQEQMVAQGLYSREEFLLEKRAMTGWPRVNTMHERAIRRHLGVQADPALTPLAALFCNVAKGSATWQAWKALHKERGWPWFGQDRDCPDWIWLPSPPEELSTYSSALDAVQAAITRFETEHASITERQAAE
ncbi:helix-turn-helix domain-containing protein [Roseibium sp. HPY-6]|uniref:helix-turn-helix domain-containing protein n=1 Tax=Roseibium sp. HPY-6 TaxID=3229852 RepID=UPI00338D45CB